MKDHYFKLRNTRIVLLLLMSSFGFGQVSQSFNSSGTFTVPPGITSITVDAWGAGGGGGGGDGNNSAGGGGGGAYAKYLITVTAGQTYTINVGKGGESNTSGENSSVKLGNLTLAQATGGGAGMFSDDQLGGAGGVASSGGASLFVSYAGGNGGEGTGRGGLYNEYGGAGGGGSAGTGGPGGNGAVPSGGSGGTGGVAGSAGNGGQSGSIGGAGGSRPWLSNEAHDGKAGSVPGSGGGGRSSSGVLLIRSANGGAGANGKIIISYNCPSDAGTLSGIQNICTNATTTFSATLAGGSWSSSSTAIATVSASGLVTGKSFGTAVITYTIASASCTTRTIIREVYVGNKPTIAAISTPAILCSGMPFNSAMPAITANGSVVTSQGWQLETAVSSGTFAVLTIPYTVSFADDGKKIRYFATNSCGTTYSNQVNLTVTPLNTAGTASSSPTLCINTALTPITHATTGATGISNSGVSGGNGLPAGVKATWESNTITISGTPIAFGTFNYSIPLTGGCGTASATGTIKVTAERTVTVAPSSPVICIGQPLPKPITFTTTGITKIVTSQGLPDGVTVSYTSGIISISGSPKQSGEFNYTITPDGCGTATATGTITVLAERTVSAASSSPKTCINTLIKGDGIIHNTTGVTAILSAVGLPNGVTAIYTSGKPGTSGVITISGAPKQSGIFNYIITPDGCGSATAIGTITVTANMTVSAPSSLPILCSNTALTPITHVTTDATGIHDSGVSGANGLPAGVSATWSENIITISGTPTVIGTFNYSIPLVGCGKVNATGTIKTDALTTYSNGEWSNEIPDVSKRAIFQQSYSTLENEALIACSCIVESGATLTIIPKSSVTIQNDISNNGNIIVESDGNLIQNNDNGTYTGGNGLFKVMRDSRMKRLDYTYWSAPVTGQNFYKFSPATVSTRFLEYYEDEDWFYPVSWSTNFQIAKGYAIRAPNNFPATLSESNPLNLFKGIFVGNPNNGSISFSLKHSANGYNLVGNPYPSNIDFEKLLNVADSDGHKNSDKIFGTAYFWTNTNPNPPQQGSKYDGNNYAIYNGTGGVSATSTTSVNGQVIPNQFIKVGQGFIIKAKETANEKPLVFNNFIRSDDKSSNFFSKGNTAVKDRYWLTLTSPALNVNTILIGYIRQATNDFELDYDAPLMTIGSDSFFSILNESKLGIQGRQYPLSVSDVVPLGSNHYETGDYILSLGDRQGVFASTQNIYLKDKQTGTVTNLSEKAYTFTANKGLTDGRFEIRYQPEIVLATDASSKGNLVIYRDGNEFVLKSSTKNITRLEVYDASGRLMIKLQPNQKDARIDAGTFANGVYILKINQEGTIVRKKVIK